MDDSWKDALIELGKALSRLGDALHITPGDNELAIDGTLQRFEFTFELFWKTLNRLLRLEGFDITGSPKQVLREAYRMNWLNDEAAWVKMLSDRNLISHTYDEAEAKQIYHRIADYYSILKSTYESLLKRFPPHA